MSVPGPELGAEQLGGAGGDDLGARRRGPGDHRSVAGVAGDLDAPASVGVSSEILVDPGAPWMS